jgi:hypothetical protein
MVCEVHIVDGEHERFAHPQAVVIDHAKQRPVAGGVDGIKEAFEFVLAEVFG